jgi:predicted nucleic acid-binding protein
VTAARFRAFLDANVLFSAAWREDAGLLRLWSRADARLITSHYATDEALRNLETAAQRERLFRLTASMDVVSGAARGEFPEFPRGVSLPEKDRPILVAAVRARATHLLTGDARHFGRLYGRVVGGVLILRPSEFLVLPKAQPPSKRAGKP